MSYEEFENMVVEADKMGFRIVVHAIGDKENYWTLNAFEKAQKVNKT
jgi:predicted amidohydrolase YtcJ